MHGVRWQLKTGYNEAFRSREIYTKREEKHTSRYDRTEESKVVLLSMANVSYTEVGNPMLAHLKLLLMYAPRNLLSQHSPEVFFQQKNWVGGRPTCCRLTHLLGGERHALGLSKIQGMVGILRLRAVHAWWERFNSLTHYTVGKCIFSSCGWIEVICRSGTYKMKIIGQRMNTWG